MSHKIYISVGSNVDREKHTLAGLQALTQEFGQLSCSNVYESEAIGFHGSHFYNLVVGAETSKSVTQVCKALKLIESENGRVRQQKKYAPRTLDLDLLLYDQVITEDGVELPRAEILYNAFVLLPLSELAPDYVHPLANKTIDELWQAYNKTQQKLWKIDFNWSNTQL